MGLFFKARALSNGFCFPSIHITTVHLCLPLRFTQKSKNADFKKNIQEEIEGDNKVWQFRLYCEKVLMDL